MNSPSPQRRLILARPFKAGNGRRNEFPVAAATIDPSPAFSRPGMGDEMNSPSPQRRLILARPFQGREWETK